MSHILLAACDDAADLRNRVLALGEPEGATIHTDLTTIPDPAEVAVALVCSRRRPSLIRRSLPSCAQRWGRGSPWCRWSRTATHEYEPFLDVLQIEAGAPVQSRINGGKTEEEQPADGMPGIRDEFQRFLCRHPGGPAYVLGLLDGEAARLIADLEHKTGEPNGLSAAERRALHHTTDADLRRRWCWPICGVLRDKPAQISCRSKTRCRIDGKGRLAGHRRGS